jgi:hypothetical protein
MSAVKSDLFSILIFVTDFALKASVWHNHHGKKNDNQLIFGCLFTVLSDVSCSVYN